MYAGLLVLLRDDAGLYNIPVAQTIISPIRKASKARYVRLLYATVSLGAYVAPRRILQRLA